MNYVLVIIMLASPHGQNGGFASNVIIDNFKTEQECRNALDSITIPKVYEGRISLDYTKQCVAKSL